MVARRFYMLRPKWCQKWCQSVAGIRAPYSSEEGRNEICRAAQQASSRRASATSRRASPVERSSTTLVWPLASRRRRSAASLRRLLRYLQRPACSPGQYLPSEVAGYPGFRYARPPRLANRTESHSYDEQHVDFRVRSSLPRGLCGFRSGQPALPGPHTLFGGSGGDKAHHNEGDEARQHSPDYGGVREQPV
jgi:hypothetical protein